jgi:prepilin-type N-terminal cleavage/methylation domain-containing protein
MFNREKLSITPFLAGFTLLEVSLAVSLIAILSVIILPVSLSLYGRNALHVDLEQVSETLRRAQLLAVASNGDSRWGIFLSTGMLTLFQGESYASRVSANDETVALVSRLSPSSMTEIVFSKIIGEPNGTGSIILMNDYNETRTLTINAKGVTNEY